VIDLNSPIFAQELKRLVEQRVDARIAETQPRHAYGTIAAVDTSAKKVSVYLYGEATPTVGFRYEDSIEPIVGQRVRLTMYGGDKYVDGQYGVGKLHGVLEGFARLRFVPTVFTQVVDSSVTAPTGILTSAVQTVLPTTAKVAVCTLRTSQTVGTIALQLSYLRHYASGDIAVLTYTPPSLNYYQSALGLVAIGGDRQIKYECAQTAGTVRYLVNIVGYFTDDA
jgi:hypothetical protein